MKSLPRRVIKAFAIYALLGSFTQFAYALPTVQTAACINDASAVCATGVTGVDVLGTLYDVAFSQASYDVLFASSPPTFQNDDTGGFAAVAAIIPILNGADIRGLFGAPEDSAFESFLFVPTMPIIAPLQFNRAASYFTGADFAPNPGRVNFTSDDQSLYNPGRFNAFAVFTRASVEVPAPAVHVLFGVGLACLGFSRCFALRRREHKTQQCLLPAGGS